MYSKQLSRDMCGHISVSVCSLTTGNNMQATLICKKKKEKKVMFFQPAFFLTAGSETTPN